MAGFVEEDRGGGGGSLLLLLAAGAGVYLYLQSTQSGVPLGTAAQQAATSLETWLTGLIGPAVVSPAPTIIPLGTTAPSGGVVRVVSPAPAVYAPPGGGIVQGSVPGAVAASLEFPAQLLTPAPGSVLLGPTATFTWSAGQGVREYWLSIGRTPSWQRQYVYDQSQGLALGATVGDLPTDGGPLFVRVSSRLAAGWSEAATDDVSYIAATPAGLAAGLTAPATPLPITTAPPVALAPVAAVIGAAGVALSDLDTARVIEGLTFSVVQKGGQVIQALNLADLADVLQVVGVVGLVIDMAFTILGNASDAQKAFDTALDAIMIACLFIPVYGWAIALVVAIVKMIGDMFGFGQGLTHAQREALERQKYGEELAPMLADLGHAYSPREMVRVLIAWGSGSTGGVHAVAMAAQLRDGAGGMVEFAAPGTYIWPQLAGTTYRGVPIPAGGLTVDQQAMLLVQYGPTDFTAEAQVGIREDLKTIFNTQVAARVQQKLPTWQGILSQGGTLDDLDVVADEIRLTPDLNALAAFYQWGTWQAGLSAMLQPLWADYYAAHPTGGSLAGFARAHGYTDLRAWRTALFAPLWPAWQRWHQAMDACADVVDRVTRSGGVLQLAAAYNPPYVDPNVTGAGGGA